MSELPRVLLPALPDGYAWKIDLYKEADYEVEVYRFDGDPEYGDKTLVAWKTVKNNFLDSVRLLQQTVDELAVKINRGATNVVLPQQEQDTWNDSTTSTTISSNGQIQPSSAEHL